MKRRGFTRFLAALGAAAWLTAGASASELPSRYLVRAGKIYTGGSPAVLSPGSLLVVDGKVAAVGEDLEAPPGIRVLDWPDAVLMPGVVLATSSFATRGAGYDSIGAHHHASEGFLAYQDFRKKLLGGVTTAYLSPGNQRLVSGQGAVVKLAAGELGEAIFLADPAHLEVHLGPLAFRPPLKVDFPDTPSSENPIQPATRQLPTTRLGQLLGLREAWDLAKSDPQDLSHLALAQAVQTGRTVRIHANQIADILGALEVAPELGKSVLLCGLQQGDRVARELGQAGHPVVVEIGLDLDRPPADRNLLQEELVTDPETAAKLLAQGLKVALSTPYSSDGEDILVSGAIAMRGGLTREQAVQAMTRTAAQVLGVADRVGSLAPGKDADFLVLNGEPFLGQTSVQRTVVNGKVVADQHGSGSLAGSVVIRAGTILPVDGAPIADGAVLLQDGKIAAVGAHVPVPPGARIVDAGPDAVVTPGFLDCNSHLGLGSERGALAMSLDLSQLVAHPDDDSLEVAKAGVTTVLMQPAVAHSTGSRVVAVKTGGTDRSDRLVDSLAALKFPWRGNVDPLLQAKKMRDALAKGKKYHESWEKHFEELKKWEEERKSGKVKKIEKKPEVEEEVKTETRSDPVTGKWEVSVSGGPLPQPQSGTMYLKLENGGTVSGSFAALFGGDDNPVGLAGTFADNHLSLELEVETPIGPPTVEADIDAEDHLQGVLAIGSQFALDIEGNRTEKEFKEVTVIAKKKKSADGRPEPPETVAALEPYRRLFKKEVPALLDIDAAIGIRHALDVFVGEFEVEVVLLGAEGANRVLEEVKEKARGVVAPKEIVQRRRHLDVVPAAELSAASIPVAFQSDAGNGGRGLPLNTAYAVRRGMGPGAALRALTFDAARLFHLEDRVGSLKPGMDGDVVVFSGDPFELTSRVLSVFVAGKEVDREAKP